MASVDVAVIGGGVSGLAVAYELHRRGVHFALLEATPRLGGVIRTDHIDGFTLDAGPDSLLAQKPAGIQLCEELGLENRLISTLEPRTAYVLRQRLHPIPAGSVMGVPSTFMPWVTSSLLSPKAKLRMAQELFLPPGNASQESVGQFFRRRFGQEAVDYLAEPLLAGIHAGDVEKLSIAALFPRLVEAEQSHGSVIRALQHQRKRPVVPNQGMFRSLAGGLEELVQTLRMAIPSEAIRVDSPVMAIIGPSPYTLQVRSARRLIARSVILATPAHSAAGLVKHLDERLAALCREIPYTSSVTVLLAYPRSAIRKPKPGSGFVVPRLEPNIPLLAGSWVTSKWPDRAPEDFVLLRGFLGDVRNPEILESSSDELVTRTHHTFAQLLDINQKPVLSRVYRWQQANAQHNVGHIGKMEAIEHRLKRLPGVFITGAGFRGTGIPDCVRDGRKTAVQSAEWQAECA